MTMKLLGVAALLGLVATSAHASSTISHSMVVSGQAQGGVPPFGCATSGPQAMEEAFFDTGVGLPTEGYTTCHLSGGIVDASHATGPSATSKTLSNSYNGGVDTFTTSSVANYGSLKVQADGASTRSAASESGATFSEGEAAAYFDDTIKPPGSGAGFIEFGFSIDGSAVSTGNSQILTFLNYEIGGGEPISMFIGDTLPGLSEAISPDSGVSGNLPGFTVTSTGISGSAEVYTFKTPVTLGVPIEIEIGLYAASYPGAGGGVADNDFVDTAKLNNVQLFDAEGNPISNFIITSTSGTIYDALGAHLASAAPEPSSWTMLVGGLFGTGWMRRRRRSTSTCTA